MKLLLFQLQKKLVGVNLILTQFALYFSFSLEQKREKTVKIQKKDMDLYISEIIPNFL